MYIHTIIPLPNHLLFPRVSELNKKSHRIQNLSTNGHLNVHVFRCPQLFLLLLVLFLLSLLLAFAE